MGDTVRKSGRLDADEDADASETFVAFEKFQNPTRVRVKGSE